MASSWFLFTQIYVNLNGYWTAKQILCSKRHLEKAGNDRLQPAKCTSLPRHVVWPKKFTYSALVRFTVWKVEPTESDSVKLNYVLHYILRKLRKVRKSKVFVLYSIQQVICFRAVRSTAAPLSLMQAIQQHTVHKTTAMFWLCRAVFRYKYALSGVKIISPSDLFNWNDMIPVYTSNCLIRH